MRLQRVFLWTVVGWLALAAMAGVYAILFPGNLVTDEIVITTMLVGAHSVLAIACAAVLDRNRWRIAMIAGLTLTGVSLAGWVFLVWSSVPWEFEELFSRVAGTCAIAVIWLAATGVLMLLPVRTRRTRIVRGLTIGVGFLFGLLFVLAIWDVYYFIFPRSDDVLSKLLAVTGIFSALGVLASPIMWKIDAVRLRELRTPTVGPRVEVVVRCPCCGREAPHRTGGSVCAGCGLRITIDVAEPVCACGYQLYGFEGERCPECGRAVSERDRWAGALVKGGATKSGHPPEGTDARENDGG